MAGVWGLELAAVVVVIKGLERPGWQRQIRTDHETHMTSPLKIAALAATKH